MSDNILEPVHYMCKPGFLAPALAWRCLKCRRPALTRRGALRLSWRPCRGSVPWWWAL